MLKFPIYAVKELTQVPNLAIAILAIPISMSSKNSLKQRLSFEDRLVAAFGGLSLKEIAARLDSKYSSFWNWVKGRTAFPTDKLALAGKLTGYSLNWLLTGEGDPLTVESRVFTDRELAEKVNSINYGLFTIELFVFELAEINHLFRGYLTERALRRALEVKASIEGIVDSWDERYEYLRLARVEDLQTTLQQVPQELGTVDSFDIAAAVEKYDNAAIVLASWYAFDRAEAPDISAMPFSGWEGLTLEEKVQEIKAARGIIDRQRARRKRYAPKES